MGELDAKRPERARTLTEYRSSFLFASFFRLQTEKIVLGYNNDKIVLAITKNSRFAKIHSLLK